MSICVHLTRKQVEIPNGATAEEYAEDLCTISKGFGRIQYHVTVSSVDIVVYLIDAVKQKRLNRLVVYRGQNKIGVADENGSESLERHINVHLTEKTNR